MGKKRMKMSSKKSRKLFSKTAKKTNPKNNLSRPMRGGFRL